MIHQKLSEVTAVDSSFYYFSSLSLYKRDMSELHILSTINHMDYYSYTFGSTNKDEGHEKRIIEPAELRHLTSLCDLLRFFLPMTALVAIDHRNQAFMPA